MSCGCDVSGATATNFAEGVRYEKDGDPCLVEVNASYTVAADEKLIAVTSTAAARTITLPSLVSVTVGHEITVKDTSNGAATNNITVDGSASETIDGAATYVISKNRGNVTIRATVGGWIVVSDNQVTAGEVTGLTAGQVVYGATAGGIGQSAGLTYDDTAKAAAVVNAGVTATDHAVVRASVSGESGGDPVLSLLIAGVINWVLGPDNSTADNPLKLAGNTSLSNNPGDESMIVFNRVGTILTTILHGFQVNGSTHLGASGSGTVGFFDGTTPVAQPSSTGEVDGFTAGAGAAVLVDSTFTGDSGTKAYTVGDIVKHLKALGLLAPS